MPPKGGFWAKPGPFGAPGGPEEARYKAKVCGYHEFDQTVAVGTKSGTPGPSEDLRGPQKGILRLKQALFACFRPFSRTGWFQMGYNSAG